MPTETLLPNGTISITGWTVTGGGGNAATACSTADGDTSYITTPGGTARTATLKVGSLSAIVSKINTVKTVSSCKGEINAEDFKMGHVLGGNSTYDATFSSTTSYVTRTSGSLPRPGGGSWAISDFNAAGNGVSMQYTNTGSGTEGKISYMAAEVDVDYGGGGFAFLIASLVGAAIGVEHLAGLAQTIYARTHGRILIRPEEYLEMLRDLRNWTRPRRLFLHRGLGGLWTGPDLSW